MSNRQIVGRKSPFSTGIVDNVVFTVGAETGGNTINVAMQFMEGNQEIAERVNLPWYLSNDANGDSLITTAPSGGIAIGTDGLLIESTANKEGSITCEADGAADVNLVEVGTLTCYLVLVLPSGRLVISDAITFV